MRPIGIVSYQNTVENVLPTHFVRNMPTKQRNFLTKHIGAFLLVTKLMLTNNSTIDTKCQQLLCFGQTSHNFFSNYSYFYLINFVIFKISFISYVFYNINCLFL